MFGRRPRSDACATCGSSIRAGGARNYACSFAARGSCYPPRRSTACSPGCAPPASSSSPRARPSLRLAVSALVPMPSATPGLWRCRSWRSRASRYTRCAAPAARHVQAIHGPRGRVPLGQDGDLSPHHQCAAHALSHHPATADARPHSVHSSRWGQ